MKSIIKTNAFAGNTNISKIVFLNNHDNVPDNAEDYSALRDKSVMGWYADPYGSTLIIAPMYGDKVIANEDSRLMFWDCRNLILIKGLENLDTSNVQNMRFMFHKCYNLKSLDLSTFDTSKVTDMSYMFAYCRSLNTIQISNFDMTNIAYTDSMFSNCVSLERIDMPKNGWNKIKSMTYMFFNCLSLKQLNFFMSKISNGVQITDMFLNCDNLQISKTESSVKG